MPPQPHTVPAPWSAALAAFAAAQTHGGVAATTLALREKHVTRFAVDSAHAPWKVTHEDLLIWLAGLSCGRSTMLSHRQSLRAFYRWAYVSNRIPLDPSDEPSRRAKKLDVPDAWEPELRNFRTYLRANGRPDSTIELRMSQLRRFAREIPSQGPFDVTLDDLADWLGAKRWTPETRRSHRDALRVFYRWAHDTKRVKRNPAKKLPRVPVGHHLPRPARDDDYTFAVAVATSRERLALRLAAELGMRCGEVCRVHSRDLAGRSGEWTLTVHGKGNKERLLPVPDSLAAALHTRPEGYAFPGRFDGHLSPHYMGKVISRLLPPGVAMHALRHRFATRVYSVDRDVFAVQQLLGHASPATTQRYVQVSESGTRRLVELMALSN